MKDKIRYSRFSPSRQLGFTLLELMISVAVLAIAMTGVVSAIYQTTQINDLAGERNIAINAARDYIERVKAQPRNNNGEKLTTFLDNHSSFDVNGLEPGNTSEGSITYDDSNTGYIIVTVTVSWDGVYSNQTVGLTRNVYEHR